MGISDKMSGRVKQAAGDLVADESIRREGADEERKGDAKDELARDEQRAERAESRAEAEAERADARAEAAAEREYDRAAAKVETEDARALGERRRADERADEVERLERRT